MASFTPPRGYIQKYFVDNEWIDMDSEELTRLNNFGGKAAMDDAARQKLALIKAEQAENFVAALPPPKLQGTFDAPERDIVLPGPTTPQMRPAEPPGIGERIGEFLFGTEVAAASAEREALRKLEFAEEQRQFDEDVKTHGILSARLPGGNPEVPTPMDAMTGLLMSVPGGMPGQGPHEVSRNLARQVERDAPIENLLAGWKGIQPRLPEAMPREAFRPIEPVPSAEKYGPFDVGPKVEPPAKLARKAEVLARAEKGEATEPEMGELYRDSLRASGPSESYPSEPNVNLGTVSSYAEARALNMVKEAHRRIKDVAARVTDLPEIKDLSIEADPTGFGRYYGKRGLRVGQKNLGVGKIPIITAAKASKNVEEFGDYLFNVMLEEAGAHSGALHDMKRAYNPKTKKWESVPKVTMPGGTIATLPEEAARHDVTGDLLRRQASAEEAQFGTFMEILNRNTDINKVRDQFKEHLRNNPEIFNELKKEHGSVEVDPAFLEYNKSTFGADRPIKPDPRDVDISLSLLNMDAQTPIRTGGPVPESSRRNLEADLAEQQAIARKKLEFGPQGMANLEKTMMEKLGLEGEGPLQKEAKLVKTGGPVPEAPPPEATVTWKDFAESRPDMPFRQIMKEWKAFKIRQGGPPPPAKEKGPKLGKLSWLDRVAKPVIHNWGKISPELGTTARSFVDRKESLTGELISQYDRITVGLKDTQKEVIRGWLENEFQGALPPELVKPAQQIKELNRVAYDLAEKADVLKQERTYYFPHRFEPGKGPRPEAVITQTSRGISIKEAGFEQPRRTERQDYIKNLDVLKDYYYDLSKRVAIAENFGPQGQKIAKLLKGARVTPATFDYFSESFKALTEHSSRRSPTWVRGTMRMSAWLQLPFAAPLQLGQSTNTMAYGNVGRSAKALWHIAGRSNYKAQLKQAMKSGALNPDILMEVTGHNKKGDPVFGKLPAFLKNSLWGIPTTDRAMRVHAYTVGEFIGKDAAAGKADAIKLIKGLGLDPAKVSPAEVGRALSDETQFRTGPGEIPLWASHPYGKMVFQYKNFLYRYTVFAGGLIRDAKQGNYKPLATFMAAAPIVGEIVNDLRALLRGRPLEDDEKRKNWTDDEWNKAFTTRRVPWDQPAARLFQNWLTIGGFGILQPYIEQIFLRDEPTTIAKLAGPVPSFGEEAGQAAIRAYKKGSAEPLGKFMVEELVPGYGYDISNYLFPKKKKRARYPRRK